MEKVNGQALLFNVNLTSARCFAPTFEKEFVMKRLFYFLIIWVVVIPLQAQVNFRTVVSKTHLTTDERLRVNFEISSNRNFSQSHFTPPTFEGFLKIMGPSTSQEMSYINGRITSKFSYGYILQPTKTGKLTIGPASVVVDGKTYQTQPVEIWVGKGQNPAVTPTPGGVPGGAKNNNITVKSNIDNAFLSAELTKTNPYVNEAVGLVYKLYIPRNYGVVNYTETAQPQYNGFWAQDVDRKISGPFEGTVNGKPYIYYILRKKLLFPQKSGKLVVKPLTLQIDLQVPVYRNFFGMRVPDYEVQRIKLTSGQKVLRVKELPKKNQPVDFSGAVGSFDLVTKIDRQKVNTDEPVDVRVQVRGTGNLKLFDLPKLKAPAGLEVYEPKHIEHIQTTFAGNKGVVEDDYVIVPNALGKYVIPGIRFVYFDPKSHTYVTKTTDDLILFVSGNAAGANSNTLAPNGTAPKTGAVDFRFIKEKAHFVSKNSAHFYRSKLFYSLILGAFFLAFLVYVYYKYLSTRVYDEALEQKKRTKSLATKFLKEAKKSMGQKEQFYARLEKALHNFLKAQLNLDTTEMTRENIRRKLQEKGVDSHQIDLLLDLLNRCDMARYAPATMTKMTEDFADAEKLMNSF